MIKDRAFVAAEVLDDIFGAKDYHELLGEKVTDAADVAFKDYELYGYKEDEVQDFAINRMTNIIWNMYSGGDTCYNAARRIYEGWQNSGVL